jgi:hypothetical protein
MSALCLIVPPSLLLNTYFKGALTQDKPVTAQALWFASRVAMALCRQIYLPLTRRGSW